MSRRKRRGSGGVSEEGWLQTYADTVTLLLTFFVLLYSFSSVDAEKFKQISSAFQSVFSGQNGETVLDFNMKNGDVALLGETMKMDKVSKQKKDELYDKVKNAVQKSNLQNSVNIKSDTRGVLLELEDNILFETAQADIKQNSLSILDKINKIISSLPNYIVVEGHTDNVPIKNYRYDSNWELSTQRAVNVLKYFVETKKQNPERFTAAGYGEFKPIYPNDTLENRSKNRRVTIVIVSIDREGLKK